MKKDPHYMPFNRITIPCKEEYGDLEDGLYAKNWNKQRRYHSRFRLHQSTYNSGKFVSLAEGKMIL
jgi:hypothetical protein